MAGIILDSSVYIDSLRNRDFSLLLGRRIVLKGKSFSVYVSCVVLAELYSGADKVSKKAFAKFEYNAYKTNRLLAPNKGDWSLAGKILNSIGTKYGFEMIGRSRITNDCLIAMTARRLGLSLLTINAKDFRIISEFRSFKFEQI